ncbi:MAG TPA: glycogen debranching N-terminal domain-containing protein [Burkholderiaceae bacterium]|nr:glycogen debranching N-terminal domain-containing protein [Burkholderiaceae bacterium]
MSRKTHEDIRHEAGSRRIVQHGRSSTTSSIAHAIVIKSDELFFLCEANGDVPFDGSNGLGFYYHDCRYLNGYELRLDGMTADRLASTAVEGSSATFVLTNRDVKTAGNDLLEKESIGIKWERTLDANTCALHDSIAFSNFGVKPVDLPLTIRLRCKFEPIFAVRGAPPKKRGKLEPTRWENSALHFEYEGADKVRRSLSALFHPAPHQTTDTTAEFNLSIAPHATATIRCSLHISESPNDSQRRAPRMPASQDEHDDDFKRVRQAHNQASGEWLKNATRLDSDDPRLNRVVDQSLRDLHLLSTPMHGHRYFSAGVPWYVTLFGRDAIISALETLAFLPGRAEDTLRLLASFQGTREDHWRDEEPGKIMHELRVGEMAHLDEIPQTPYYGTVDATPLFLILLARHAEWTGRLDLFTELEPHVQAALSWIDHVIAQSGSGYLTYATLSGSGLTNQGWKDSGDSIMNCDGSLATPPIALVEVQGYVYMAKKAMATLYRRIGDSATADRLGKEAEELCARFQRDFWMDDLETYALALQKGNQPAAVVSSNPGHALWTGIATPERALKTAERLMREDMFSGWGIRTLSSRERRFNPLGYHDGTVWPHDNAIAVAGFRRYGCLSHLSRVIDGIVDAAVHFPHGRLPEVFAGFSRQEFSVPVRYPVACHPQAWAAGAVPFMIESALGLRPDAFNHSLHISRPELPESVHELTLKRLRVGDAVAEVRFKRNKRGNVAVEHECAGHLDVILE